MKPLSVS
jgi:hypothetical protein